MGLLTHSTYIEPFCSGASVFLNLNTTKNIRPLFRSHGGKQYLEKRIRQLFPTQIFDNYVLSDLNEDVINLYKVFQEEYLFEEFYKQIQSIEYSEENFEKH